MHKPKFPVVVLIPLYKAELTQYEKISLDRCIKVLGKYSINIIAPQWLSPKAIYNNIPSDIKIEYFDDEFFKSVGGYNKLMLQPDFYKRFLDSKYILVYQLDAFVFSDQLSYWCSLSYDYIGAPWFGVDWFDEFDKPGLGNLWKYFGENKCMVGNGGFSLRRVRSSLLALFLLRDRAKNWEHNEDIFWSFEVPNNLPFFRKPSLDIALKFSFELNPRDCFQSNNGSLPFGCHAWEKYDIDFWRPKFAAYGYQI